MLERHSLALETERRCLRDGATSLSITRELATCHLSLGLTRSKSSRGRMYTRHSPALDRSLAAVLELSLTCSRTLYFTVSPALFPHFSSALSQLSSALSLARALSPFAIRVMDASTRTLTVPERSQAFRQCSVGVARSFETPHD